MYPDRYTSRVQSQDGHVTQRIVLLLLLLV
jgi:hypothetical protein